MSRITGMAKKGRGKRVNIFLDGEPAFSLLAEVAVREGLQVGQELSAGRVEALARADRYHSGLDAALRYLGYRPRSEAELSHRLRQRGFDDDSIKQVVAKLKEQGLLDDAAFARFWKENRESFRPRSRHLTRLELRRKGLADSIIEPIVAGLDDRESAYRAALSKARRLSPADYGVFRRRLGEYLRRRGFGYEVINDTIRKIWQECGSPGGRLPDGSHRVIALRHHGLP
jgi:regulatory protein